MIKRWDKAYKMHQQGKTQVEIAKYFGVSLSAVKYWSKKYWRKYEETAAWREELTVPHDASGIQRQAAQIDIKSKESVSRQIATYKKDYLPDVTQRESLFITEYLQDFNPKNAALRAGYTITEANNAKKTLMENPVIYAHIQVALAEMQRRIGYTAEAVDREQARIAFVNPLDVINVDGEISPDAKEDDLRAISDVVCEKTIAKNGDVTIKRRVKFYDKGRALEYLSKRLGLANAKIPQHNIVNIYGSMSTDDIKKALQSQEDLYNRCTRTVDSVSTDDDTSDENR